MYTNIYYKIPFLILNKTIFMYLPKIRKHYETWLSSFNLWYYMDPCSVALLTYCLTPRISILYLFFKQNNCIAMSTYLSDKPLLEKRILLMLNL